MVNHIMVDLETMGTSPNAAIMSIGACVFDPHAVSLASLNYYQNIDLASCMKVGLTVDAGTIEFWMKQPDAAINALWDDRWDITRALKDFSSWIGSTTHSSGKDVRIWAHGSNFDIVVLESAYRACGLVQPWAYNAMRDDRTLFELAGVDLKDFSCGTLHNALDDARNQAMAVQESYRRLKK
jgi:hypothetical protein